MGLRGVYGGGLGGGEGGSGEGWVRTQRGARLWFAGAACGYFFSAAASATSARDERCVHPGWRRGVGNEPWRGGRCAAPRRRQRGWDAGASEDEFATHTISHLEIGFFFEALLLQFMRVYGEKLVSAHAKGVCSVET